MRPVLQESLRVYVGAGAYRRAHLIYLSIVGLLMLALWPTAPYIDFFKLSTYPPLYEVVAIAILLILVAGSMYAGKTSFARSSFISNTDWIEKTTVSPLTVAAGKLVAGTLHTAVLSGVAFPFLVVAAGPSGVPIGAIGASLSVIFVASLAARFGGVWIDAGLERRPVFSVLSSWAILGAIFVVSIELFPDMNPIIAITSIAGTPDLSFASFRMALTPIYLRSVLVLAVCSILFAAAATITMVIRRRRFSARKAEWREGVPHGRR